MFFLGIDMGSASAKGLIMAGKEVLAQVDFPSGGDFKLTADRIREELLAKARVPAKSISWFTAITATNNAMYAVDMSQVSFVSSIGIRLLVSCAKANANRGGKFVLVSPQPLVLETFQIAGIDNLIPIYADEQSAIAALKG